MKKKIGDIPNSIKTNGSQHIAVNPINGLIWFSTLPSFVRNCIYIIRTKNLLQVWQTVCLIDTLVDTLSMPKNWPMGWLTCRRGWLDHAAWNHFFRRVAAAVRRRRRSGGAFVRRFTTCPHYWKWISFHLQINIPIFLLVKSRRSALILFHIKDTSEPKCMIKANPTMAYRILKKIK